MRTRTDELLEDYKAAIGRVRLNVKVLLTLAFFGAIAAGSYDGFKGAKALFAGFFGDPGKPELFVRWYPLAIGLYAVAIWFQYWERISLRRRVVHEIESKSRDEALAYRLHDDLTWASWMPRIMGRSTGQLCLLAAPLLLMLLMWIPFKSHFRGWPEPTCILILNSFKRADHILAWTMTGILPLVAAVLVIFYESRINQQAIRLTRSAPK